MKWRFAFLGLLAIAQIALPASMIYQYEAALRYGRVFKFKTAPVDPYDAFRGRYVALSFAQNSVPTKESFDRGTPLWAVLREDADGFASIERVSRMPLEGDNVLPVSASYSSGQSVTIEFPFNRFYMEESAAPRAEAAYREHSRGANHDAYVTVRVRHGVAAIEQLYLDGQPVRDYLRAESAPK